MEAALQNLPLETLQRYLSEALDARHRLATEPTSFASADKRIQFEQSARDNERYISQLQNAIAAKQRGGAVRYGFEIHL